MHGEDIFAYGLWGIVVINVALFVFFILSFIKPMKKREWRSMRVTIAFFVALFTEMYGFPLTIYLLTGFLGDKYPAVDPFTHANGHLWAVFLGGDSFVFTLVSLSSNLMAFVGFWIMWKGWKLVHGAEGELVTEGPYSYVRHPQYSGLFLVVTAMLVQWPTFLTVLMFPVLSFMYYRLSIREESDMIKAFGEAYGRYRDKTPMFVPG